MGKFFKHTYLAFIFLILYLPIFILILFSFNSGASIRNFQGWSWKAYSELLAQVPLWQSVSVTLIVAFISTIVAVIVGTFAALGLSKSSKITRSLTLGITNIPLVNADIVTAVSLMLLFMAFAFNFGIVTLIFAHISFNIPYVIITVLPKIRSIDQAQLEASQDLGATPWYTLRKIVLPTIKPAIIAGAAIAFAMSFDDFIISYFTGGNAANVSTYIYSLKRVQPYVNAFSTIIIILVALIVISWNTWTIVRKQIKNRNEKIINQTYRDKRIIKMEKTLNKYYLQLNDVKNVKPKKQKFYLTLFQPVIENNENLMVDLFSKKIDNHQFIIKRIQHLEAKLVKEMDWVQQIARKIKHKKVIKERESRKRRERFHFLRWPWKLIMSGLLVTGVFSGATAFYVISNNYNLTIANWGNYITPEILKGFEAEYNVKVKYTTYSDNESLYAKLSTTNYDVMVPSDYMIAQLASEGRLAKLNSIDPSVKFDINKTLNAAMKEYKFKVVNEDGSTAENNLTDFAVPYFWGDLVLVFNTVQNPNLLKELNITTQAEAGWDTVKTALSKGKKVVLNDDMHNLFSLGLTTLNFNNELGNNKGLISDPTRQEKNTFRDYVNAQKISDIEKTADWLKPIFSSPDSRFENDQIVDTIAINKGWDVSVLYNGDLLSAMQQGQQNGTNTDYTVVRPYVGTNLWNDDMVISKDSQNKELALNFIKYIMEQKNQVALSEEFGYTSPLNSAINTVSEDLSSQTQKDVYIPGTKQIKPPGNSIATVGYYNGLYKRDFDKPMQTAFNKLQVHQGSNSNLSLLIKLVIVAIIIIVFIIGVVLIK